MSDRQWWNCTLHSFGWRGDLVPCPLCGNVDHVQPGIAVEESHLPKHCGHCDVLWVGSSDCWHCGTDTALTQPVTAGRAPKPHLSPRAVALAAEPLDADHRPSWAFWRRTA